MANVTLGGDCVAVVAVDTVDGGDQTADGSRGDGGGGGSTTTCPILLTAIGA